LEELLDEHSLSLSGAIDEKSAVEIGKLIGVDGYTAMENEKFILNFNLIETSTGIIVWSKTAEYCIMNFLERI
jgi:PBP1b-binding outer membrane lipoprotein LpoB